MVLAMRKLVFQRPFQSPQPLRLPRVARQAEGRVQSVQNRYDEDRYSCAHDNWNSSDAASSHDSSRPRSDHPDAL